VLQEFKNQNSKLLQYFTHEQLKKLIDFITVMPPEDATHARGHKYPFLSSEIFNCELNTVLEKFFEAPEPPQPEKDEKEGAEKSGDEGEEGEQPLKKKVSSREPMNLGGSDFRPPFADDDDEEESTEPAGTDEPAEGEESKEKKEEEKTESEEAKQEEAPTEETKEPETET
jgi:hypothetical protein